MGIKVFFLNLSDAERLGIRHLTETTVINGERYAFISCDLDQNEFPLLAEALLVLGFKGSEEEAEALAKEVEKLACGAITLWSLW